MKATSAIVGPNDDLVIPRKSTKTDWEVELAVVIGKKASYVPEEKPRPISPDTVCTTITASELFSSKEAGSG